MKLSNIIYFKARRKSFVFTLLGKGFGFIHKDDWFYNHGNEIEIIKIWNYAIEWIRE